MDYLDSENEDEAKIIILDPIMISFGRSHGSNAASSLVTFYNV